MVYFEGVIFKVRQANFKVLATAFIALASFVFSACSAPAPAGATTGNAATVNGKAISMEDVERIIKQQGQGQEAKLSPLELAQARLQALDSLIQQEVMYQKAEKEGTIPTDDQVTEEYNKAKQTSGLSADQFDKQIKDAGQTEQTLREQFKRNLAIQKLKDKITSKIEPAKDSEVEAFYKGNPSYFTKKRGVKLAAIVVDPSNSGEGDTTTDQASAAQQIKEIITQLQQPGTDFASVAREKSEDESRLQGGDLGYITEDQLRQTFGDQVAGGFMNPQFTVGKVAGPFNVQGKYYLLKLQERVDKDEALTLESPGVRQNILDTLLNARKQLLAASYQAIAMDEAKVDNLLAKQIVENPNEMSGARPADTSANSNANTTAANTNTAAIINTNINANANAKPMANANAKPAATPKAKTK